MTIAVDLGRKATKQTNKQTFAGPVISRHVYELHCVMSCDIAEKLH